MLFVKKNNADPTLVICPEISPLKRIGKTSDDVTKKKEETM